MNRVFFILAFFTTTLSLYAQSYQEQLKAIHSSVVEEKDGKSYYIHTVKKGQTLYMISKSYGVEVNDIIAENPVVKEGLKAGQKLYIPFSVQKKEEIPVKKISDSRSRISDGRSQITDGGSQITDGRSQITDGRSPVSDIPCGSDTAACKRHYKVVLMLPLYLDEVTAMNPETATEEAVLNWNSLKYLPFYEGFRLAVDSIQKQGLHLTLNVYDLSKDSLKTSQLLKKPEVRSADLIIGLLFNKNFQMVAKFAHEKHIPIVNPISERGEILINNDMVFKANPSRASMLEVLADYIQKSMYRGQILIIRNGQYKDRDIAERLKKECLERNLNVVLAEGQDVAIGKLSKTKENVIVAFTDNNVYALDLMRRFYELRNDYKISLVGLPGWEKIEGLETDFLNGLNTHLVSPAFVNYSDAGVKNIILRFQQQYKTDPEPLAFQGFDVGFYFLSALMKFGKQLPKCITDFRLNTSQTSFEFVRSGNNNSNGFENRRWSVYKYENFKLVRVN